MTQPAMTAFPDWKAIRPMFDWDGSLRDIVIQDRDTADCQHSFERLERDAYATVPYPGTAWLPWHRNADSFIRFGGQAIEVRVGGMLLKCEIVSPPAIEFDLDPRRIGNATDFEQLTRMMQQAADATVKPVLLTVRPAP
jgi:hypothetical protein